MEFLLMNWKWFSAPVICAFIGWLTNYIAVKMLFRPRRPVNCGLFTLQGVFPHRQKALAENLGKAIEKNLINHDDLRSALSSPDFQQVIHAAVASKIQMFIEDFIAANPMLALLLNPEMREKIGGMLAEKLDALVPSMLETAADKLQEHLVFSDIVRNKIEKFESEQVENLLLAVMKKEFGFIELVGGVLGFVIGVIQSLIFYFT